MSDLTSSGILEAYGTDRLPLVKETEHFSYTGITVVECPPVHLAVISSGDPIPFEDMPKVFNQVDEHGDFVTRHGLRRATDSPIEWLYHNEAEQAADPGGNPVRAPFLFEAGHQIEKPAQPAEEPSATFGKFVTTELRPLRVARTFYQGSFPYQSNSGFVEAWMRLVTEREAQGYDLTFRLYRELYHDLDWENPEKSITEIQVEIVEV